MPLDCLPLKECQAERETHLESEVNAFDPVDAEKQASRPVGAQAFLWKTLSQKNISISWVSHTSLLTVRETENTPDWALHPFLALKHHIELTPRTSHVPTVPKPRLTKSTSVPSALYLGQLPSTCTMQSHFQSLDNWACMHHGLFWERLACVMEHAKSLSHTDPGGSVRTHTARDKGKNCMLHKGTHLWRYLTSSPISNCIIWKP